MINVKNSLVLRRNRRMNVREGWGMSLAENQRNNCRSAIVSNNTKIRKYEELYDSLKQFEVKVSDSQCYFTSVNADKEKYLSDLDSRAANCRTASLYSTGMKKVLNGVGVAYVNCTYSALLVLIKMKLAEYSAAINVLEAKNRALDKTIDLLDIQIRQEAQEGNG